MTSLKPSPQPTPPQTPLSGQPAGSGGQVRPHRTHFLRVSAPAATLRQLAATLAPAATWLGSDLVVSDNFSSYQALHELLGWEPPLPPETKREQRPNLPLRTRPFEHQARALDKSWDLPSFALLMDTGTGKTKVLIDTAAFLWHAKKISQLLIVAPNSVHRQWVDQQLPQHMPDWCRYRATTWPCRTLPAPGPEHLTVLAVNVEALSTPRLPSLLEPWVRRAPTLVVVDESTRIKTPGAARTRAAWRLARLAAYRRIMTGTPVTQGAEDLYAQFGFLDPRIIGLSSFYSFRNRYCVMGGYEMREVVGYRHLDELTRLIEPYSFRATKEDCLDLPARTYQERYVPLTAQQERLYRQMRDEMVAQLGPDLICAAPQAMTCLLRLQQIVSGYLPGGEVSTMRPAALVEVMEEARGKVIVWCRFRHDVDAALLALRRWQPVRYDGAVSTGERAASIERFTHDPACRAFVGQPQSGGLGLNLTVANMVVWYSLDFNLETYLQANDRCYRIGQESEVTNLHLVSPGTVDQRVLRALRDKGRLADLVLRDLV